MPVYEYVCPEGHAFDRFLPLARYLEPQRCDCGSPAVKVISAPFVRSDIPGYRSPVTGEWIGGRAARREDLRRSGCVEYEPGFKEECNRRLRQDDDKLEKSIEHTVDSEIYHMPAVKREKLVAETEGGLDVNLVRRHHVAPSGLSRS